MPGTVLAVHVSPGDTVGRGQPVVVVEAMKMEHVITAPAAGTVRQVLVKAGDPVVLDQPVAVVES
jgi:acetyl-CoA/propionyl-CoA carboxylase biotin carboxyl carrier protein